MDQTAAAKITLTGTATRKEMCVTAMTHGKGSFVTERNFVRKGFAKTGQPAMRTWTAVFVPTVIRARFARQKSFAVLIRVATVVSVMRLHKDVTARLDF